MAAVAAMSILDGQASPVAHSFVPISYIDGVWLFEDQTGSSPIGYNRITISLTRSGPAPAGQPSDGGRNARCTIKVWVPVLETLGVNDAGITPPPTVAYVEDAKVEFRIPERSSVAVRKDTRAYTRNVLNDALVIDMLENLRSAY
jgi:hypothetical protein